MKSLPQGPQGSLLAGSGDAFKDNPLTFLTDCHSKFGNVVPFRVGIFPALFLNEPELIHEVLVNDAAHYSKDAAIKNNRNFFGNGLLSSEGDYWKRQRKLSAPAFNPKRLESYSQTMVTYTRDMISSWQDGQIVDIQHEMTQLTLQIACKTLFDVELTKDNTQLETSLTAAQYYLSERMNDPLVLMLPEWVPFSTNVHLGKAIETVNKTIFALIEQRRGHTEGRQDLLSTLMTVQDEIDDSGMSPQQIRDEVFTLFFAGHETTALTLTWTLYLLSQHPQVEARLLSELQDVLNGRPAQASDYWALPYAERVIRESMRIRPPVWAIGREALSDCTLGDYAIKRGTSIVISQWIMHHDARFYENPLEFNPDRWTAEFTQGLPKFAYFPFGGGPRTCIGNGFAMLEGVLVLATILQNFCLRPATDTPVTLVPAVTLRPEGGISMTLQRRR